MSIDLNDVIATCASWIMVFKVFLFYNELYVPLIYKDSTLDNVSNVDYSLQYIHYILKVWKYYNFIIFISCSKGTLQAFNFKVIKSYISGSANGLSFY